MTSRKLRYNGLNINVYSQTTLLGSEFIVIRISSDDFDNIGVFNHKINNLKQSIKLYQDEISKMMDTKGVFYNSKYKILSHRGKMLFKSLAE